MRAAILSAPNDVRLEEIPIPEPGENDVRVQLEGCGVCGSNLPVWEGRPWFTYPRPPGSPGHEGWGYVEVIGEKVTRVKLGDRVALLSYCAFAEYDLAPEDAVVRLPAGLDGEPFPGEALGCAMNVFRRCNIRSGDTVAIVGIGFLGVVLTALCARAGAEVIAISRREFALNMARRFGASESMQIEEHGPIVDRVKALTGNKGCDCVIEAVGLQRPLELAGELTRERGRLVIAGYHQDGLRQVNMQLWNWRGLDVINAHERDPGIYVEGMRAMVEAVAGGALDLSPIYTHSFTLQQLAAALNALKERPQEFMKALVSP
jgi:threonine dehydrogenase-like Zn-dependent dehydrogenase